VFDALKQAASQGRNILPLPQGYELKKIGFDPASLQLLELKRWQVEETARIWRLPKFFVGLTDGGTLANVEHQSQSLIRNTLMPMLIAPFESELTAKCGKRNAFVKVNLNAFVRGSFREQMEGLRTAIHGAIYTPDEARAYLDLGPVDGGDKLFINSASVPIDMAGQQPAPVSADPVVEPVSEEPPE
jgi:HK97 family phage portal protein